MKLYKILQEQEEKESPKEIRKITNTHKRMLNALSRMDIDDTEYSVIWKELIDVFQINDIDLVTEITYLYHEYSYVFDEDEKDSYKELPDDALSGLMDITGFDNAQIALSINLKTPLFLIEESNYDHYGLSQYYDLVDGGMYGVGNEDEVQSAMLEWAQSSYDSEGLDYVNRNYLDQFIELNDVSDFAEEDVDSLLDDMSEEHIIEEAGYDKDQMVEQMESMESRISDIVGELETLKDEIDEIQEMLDELEEESEEEEDISQTEEYVDLKGSQTSLIYKRQDFDSEKDNLESEMSDLETEIDGLFDTAKEEVRTSRIGNLIEAIENEGVDFFINDLGYSLEDAVRYFCDFDEEGFISGMSTDNEASDVLASYNGQEDYENVDGVYYYIYRTE